MSDISKPPVQQEQLDVEPVSQVEGTVERIVFESGETGFVVGRLRDSDGGAMVTFVGKLLAVSPGETVRLRGRWVDDKKFGRQLRAESYESILPATVEGIEKYLGSGLIEGIGPAYAKRLVEAFGAETLRVIDEQPNRLAKVPGIGPKRIKQIREAWSSQRAVRSIMVFLQGQGISTSQAVRIYKAYGDRALAVVRENPYQLAADIAGIGFAGADRIARQIGVAPDSTVRLDAGLRHALEQASGAGHVFLPAGEVLEAAAELLGQPASQLGPRLELLVQQGQLRRMGEALYLPHLFASEEGCAKVLQKLMSTPIAAIDIHMENALRWVEKHHGIALAPEQQDAIRRGVTEKVLVITGGPGTGKTTVLNSLLAVLEKKGLSFVLAAPTGRAAKRMEASTGREASTIHRLLEFSPHHGGFQRNAGNPILTDLVVVDEASMIDTVLMHQLLLAIPPFARLVLVGDVDQLPSVGPGNVLFDLIASGALPVVRLDTVFRQAAESGIVRNAHRINQGEYPDFNTEDFFLIQRPEPEEARDTVAELVTQRIPRKFGLDPNRDIQVLTPMRRGEAGVNRLNEVLREALNPHGEPLPRGNLRVGDKVMQLRNNYELDVFNGETGRIVLCDEDAAELEVAFDDGRRVLYGMDQIDDLGLAYATTVHKAQGSEYPAVVLVMLSQHYMMLQRNVLYTAVTRARRIALIVGAPKAVAAAVRNSRGTQRHTLLVDRLRNTTP